MKILIKICFIVSIIYPSYISMHGFGEYVEDNYSNSLFITEPSPYFIENNFSSIWKGTESALNVEYNYRTSKSDYFTLSESYLASLNYAFPLNKTTYCSIGFNPYTISDVDFYANDYSYLSANQIESLDFPIAYNVLYNNDGGISKSYLNLSTKVSDKLYLGFKYSFLFGNLDRNKRIRLYDLNYSLDDQGQVLTDYALNDSIIINSTNEYSGSSFQIESKYKIEKFDLFMSGTYHFPLKVKSKFFFNEGVGSMQNLEQIQTYFQPNQIVNYENEAYFKNFYLGLRYKMDDIQSLLFKLDKNRAFSYNENAMYLPDIDFFSANLSFNSTSKIFTISNLNYINYKIGLFYKATENSNASDYDYGIELDYGIRLLDKNYFALSFKFGEKSYKYIDLDNERYYLIGFKIENIEEWFLKGVKD